MSYNVSLPLNEWITDKQEVLMSLLPEPMALDKITVVIKCLKVGNVVANIIYSVIFMNHLWCKKSLYTISYFGIGTLSPKFD